MPPAPVLVKAVTMEFPFTFFTPTAEEFDQLLEIKVTLPVVFTDRFVKVLLVIFAFCTTAALGEIG